MMLLNEILGQIGSKTQQWAEKHLSYVQMGRKTVLCKLGYEPIVNRVRIRKVPDET